MSSSTDSTRFALGHDHAETRSIALDRRNRGAHWARRTGVIVALAIAAALAGQALALAVASMAEAASAPVPAAKLKSAFKKSTGQKLVLDTIRSSTGRYWAFNLGVQTPDKKARYGTFTIYLATGSDAETSVDALLTDPRTGTIGTPTGGMYWEKGRTLYGDEYWLAKKRYGSNIVLWWTAEKPVKKTEPSFTTLNKALLAALK